MSITVQSARPGLFFLRCSCSLFALTVVINQQNENAEKPAEKPAQKPIIIAEEEKKPAPMPKKSMETEPELAPVRTAEKVIEKTEAVDKSYTNLGRELPYYLL